MNKLFTKIVGGIIGLTMAIGVGVAIGNNTKMKVAKAASQTATYTFTSKSWAATLGGNAANWVCGKAAGGFGNGGIQVTNNANYTGANGTSPVSYTNVSSVVLTFNTNQSAGAGSFEVQVGSNQAKTTNWSYETSKREDGEDGRSALYTKTFDYSASPETGAVKVTVNTTTNSCYLVSCAITYDDGSAAATNFSVAVDSSGLYPGRTVQAVITESPADSALPDLSYESSNTNVFTVNSSGLITAVAAGTATLTVSGTFGSTPIEHTASVTVTGFPSVTDQITLNRYYVATGTNATATYELTSYNAVTAVSGSLSKSYLLKAVSGLYANTVAFRTDNGKYLYATDPAGGNNLGENATITAAASWVIQYEDSAFVIKNSVVYGTSNKRQMLFNDNSPKIGNYALAKNYSSITLTEVTNPLTDFSLNETEKAMFIGATDTIGVTLDPANTTDDRTVTWSSSNPSVATINSAGLITAVALGETTITASMTINAETVEKTCALSVIDSVAQHKGTEADPYTVQEAYYIANGTITEDYESVAVVTTGAYVKGLLTAYVSRTTSTLTFWMGDNAGQINAATKAFEVFQAAKVYGTALASKYGSNSEVAADFVVGATIVAKGNITWYNSTTAEFASGTADVIYSSYIEAITLARNFNTAISAVCDEDGVDTVAADLLTAWNAKNTAYNGLEAIEKAHILGASANANGTDIEKMIAKYDYIITKYNSSKTTPYNDFLGRIDSGAIHLRSYNEIYDVSSNNTASIVVLISVMTISLAGGYFLFKKKKQ